MIIVKDGFCIEGYFHTLGEALDSLYIEEQTLIDTSTNLVYVYEEGELFSQTPLKDLTEE